MVKRKKLSNVLHGLFEAGHKKSEIVACKIHGASVTLRWSDTLESSCNEN